MPKKNIGASIEEWVVSQFVFTNILFIVYVVSQLLKTRLLTFGVVFSVIDLNFLISHTLKWLYATVLIVKNWLDFEAFR